MPWTEGETPKGPQEPSPPRVAPSRRCLSVAGSETACASMAGDRPFGDVRASAPSSLGAIGRSERFEEEAAAAAQRRLRATPRTHLRPSSRRHRRTHPVRRTVLEMTGDLPRCVQRATVMWTQRVSYTHERRSDGGRT